MGLISSPSGVSASIASRNMSPVETWAMPYSREMRLACVPLPDPCGPRIKTFTTSRRWMRVRASLQEAFVRAHDHLRLHLAHRVQRDADHDQQRRPAEERSRRLREAEVPDEEGGQDRDRREVDRARQRQAREYAVEVLRGRRAGPDPWDITAVLAQVVGLVHRVELHRGVEVREQDDQERLDQEVRDVRGGEVPVDEALRLREELGDRRREG